MFTLLLRKIRFQHMWVHVWGRREQSAGEVGHLPANRTLLPKGVFPLPSSALKYETKQYLLFSKRVYMSVCWL